MKIPFLKQFDKYSIVYENNPDIKEVSPDRIYELVSARIDINESFLFSKAAGKPSAFRRFAVLPAVVAVIVMIMGITVVAYYLSVSDLFKDTLNELSPDGSIAPLSEMAPLVEKSGMLVNKTSSDGDIDITVHGVAGDGKSLKILLDIENTAGEPLAVKLDDGTYSTGGIHFGRIKMRTEDTVEDEWLSGKPDGYLAHPFDIFLSVPELPEDGSFATIPMADINFDSYESIPEGNKAAYLIDMAIPEADKDALIGKTLYLDLDYIVQTDKIMIEDTNLDCIVSDGSWSFEIPLGFENTIRSMEINKDININGINADSLSLEISPYIMTVEFSVSESSISDIEDTYGNAVNFNETAEIVMKNGSKMQAELRSSRIDYQMENSQISAGILNTLFIFDAVIDPGQVETVVFYGTELTGMADKPETAVNTPVKTEQVINMNEKKPDKEITDDETETENGKAVINSERTVISEYDYFNHYLVDESGEIYYIGYDTGAEDADILTLDGNGIIAALAKLPGGVGDIRVKQTGGNISVLYNTVSKPGSSYDGAVFHKFDKNLKPLGNYDFTLFGKGLQYIDVNDSKACYVKGGRGNSLYTADYDGGNEKLLYTLEPEAGKTIYFQEVVLNENYAAFISEPAGGYTYVSDTRNPENVTRTGSASYCYYGVIDLRTGEASVLKGGFHGRLKAFGDTFLWHGYPEGSWNNELPSEIITFKDGKFNAMETKTGQEVLTAAADNDGRIITADSGESYGDSILIRIYENGSCIKEITEDIGQPFGLGNIRANNGVIALSYTTSSGGKIKGNVKLISY